MRDRAAFVQALTANPPPPPANMPDLLRLNREGVAIPASVKASQAIAVAAAGGAGSIIDVRRPEELAAERITGARHVPLDRIAASADEVRATPAPRLLLCRSGVRAKQAQAELQRLGVGGLQVIEGGIEAWRAAGGPTVRQKGVMSMERQVRIAAGVLVVIGSALALLHPAFLVIPAFVGGGLAWSGLTDTCGMARVLAWMPWNRNAASCAVSPSTSGGISGPVAACAAGAPPVAACAAGPPPVAACAAGPPPSGPS